MAASGYTIKALDESSWDAFATLVEANNGVFGGCWCRGVATAGLADALDLIARLGGGKVEGYPEAAGAVPAGFLFNGALSTYEKLGFTRDRKIGKHRWVVTKMVERTS